MITKAKKLRAIREVLDDVLRERDYLDRESVVRDWMRYPLAIFFQSVDAGFYEPTEDNPNIAGQCERIHG